VTLALLLGAALAAPTHRVEPADRELGVGMGERWVPRDSRVQPVERACEEEEQGIQIVSVDDWYRLKGKTLVERDEIGCLPKAVLKPVAESPGLSPSELQLRRSYEDRFGPIVASAIKSTPWGRVALPMAHELSSSELDAEYRREGLLTARQKERAVVAEGPARDGHPIYAHFLGSDAARSDRWGTLATVEGLLSLADAWSQFCRERLPEVTPEANPASCLIQFGDLAWYNDARPDPLGHRQHYPGSCVDIRLFRFPASRYEAWWNRADDRAGERGGYSQVLTQSFLSFAVAHSSPSVVHFNDPVIVQAIPQVTASRGHDDHIHMCF